LALDCCSKSENGRLSTSPLSKGKLQSGVETASADGLDYVFQFEKTSFASNISGNPRSGEVHDWYALDSKSNDGLEVSLKPGVVSGRDRICFLFTMSLNEPDRAGLDIRPASLAAASS
jgi:hypothetical protein